MTIVLLRVIVFHSSLYSMIEAEAFFFSAHVRVDLSIVVIYLLRFSYLLNLKWRRVNPLVLL